MEGFINDNSLNDNVLHVILAAFALLFPVLLMPVYYRFKKLRSNYLTLGETPNIWQAPAQAYYEFNALVFAVPVLIGVSKLIPHPLSQISEWGIPIIIISIIQYCLISILAEYYKLYAISKRGFFTAKITVPIMLRFSFIIIILSPVIAAMAAFSPSGPTANAFGYVFSAVFTFYTILGILCIMLPLELDAKFIGIQMSTSAFLGECLFYVDSMVHPVVKNTARLREIARHLEYKYLPCLPTDKRKRSRLLEFAILTSEKRQQLTDTIILERFRRAFQDNERIIAKIRIAFGSEEVYLDIGAIRNRMVACNIWPCDTDYNGPIATRCLDVSNFMEVRSAKKTSFILHSPGSTESHVFWKDAYTEEGNLMSIHKGEQK